MTGNEKRWQPPWTLRFGWRHLCLFQLNKNILSNLHGIYVRMVMLPFRFWMVMLLDKVFFLYVVFLLVDLGGEGFEFASF